MRLRAATLGWFALLLVGCGAYGPNILPDASGNHCVTNAQCPGTVCDPVQHVCVAEFGRAEVVLYAAPSAMRTSAYAAATRFDPETVANNGTRNIQLLPQRRLLGLVQADGSAGLRSIAASIRFRRQNAPPTEQPVEVAAGTNASETDVAGEHVSFTYSQMLVPDRYDITVTPTDANQGAALPPLYLRNQQIQSDVDGTPLVMNFTYPAQRVAVTGRILSRTGAPIQGLQVRLVAEDSTDLSLSTVETSDWDGAFNLRLAPYLPQSAAPAHWSLEVSASVGTASTGMTPPPRDAPDYHGRFVYRVTPEALGIATAYGGATEIALRLPTDMGFPSAGESCSACAQVEISVEGARPSGIVADVRETIIELRADDAYGVLPTGHRGWYECRIQASTDGLYRARMAPGMYSGTVTPTDPAFAVTAVSVGVRRDAPVQAGRVFTLEPRSGVTGTVTARTTMVGVEVSAVPLTPLYPAGSLGPVERRARSAQTRTDTTGSYTLLLDPGFYRVVVRPPTASGYSSAISAQTVAVGIGQRMVVVPPLALNAPLTLTGTVVDSMGHEMGESLVGAYLRLRGAGTSFVDIDVARTTADAAGMFRLLLPSE